VKGGPLKAGKNEPMNPRIKAQIDRKIRIMSTVKV
jgi:hypothetical protein